MNQLILLIVSLMILNISNGQLHPKYEYKTNSHKDDSQINFPESPEAPPPEKDPPTKKGTPANSIPMELLEKLNDVSNITQFFDEFIAEDTVDPRDNAASRFDGTNVERSAAVMPKPASCMPESTVVPLRPLAASQDPTIVYFPSCTRVKRCSGCCSHALLSCQPVESNTIAFQIVKSQYVGGSKMAYKGKEIVLVDEHVQCKCDCRIKESDCNSLQVYDQSQCRCRCTNSDEQDRCSQLDEKIWDESSCRCRCRKEAFCTTGTFFDESQCRCVVVPRSSLDVLDRRKLIIKATPVSPDDNTRYYHQV